MVYSLSKDEPLCYRCKYYIEFFGAHRGGVYCQHGCPNVLWSLKDRCLHFKHDNGEKHERMFELKDYPGLLAVGENLSI